MKVDFSGWATRNGIRCTDGRTILRGAFKDCDGKTVPLVWNHDHSGPENVLGHATLENRDEGVYARCAFNDTDGGKRAKALVENGDITALSIFANQLKHRTGTREVCHGNICEVSLVLAGANPGAYIEDVMVHADGLGDEAIIYNGEEIYLEHSSKTDNKPLPQVTKSNDMEGKGNKGMDEEKMNNAGGEETVQDIFNTLSEKQKNVVYYLIGQALNDTKNGEGDDDDDMSHNAFENNYGYDYGYDDDTVLSHADQADFLDMVKTNRCASFREALKSYCEDNNVLAHGITQEGEDGISSLFPDPKLITPGTPELLRDDETDWVGAVFGKITKSPYDKVRTRHVDARKREIEARGYKKGDKKVKRADMKMLNRVTDAQTVYMVDSVHRDDILSIQDFDYVSFVKKQMEDDLKEDIATAILVGDGRTDDDQYKIHEDHIRPIYKDNELYTIRRDVDVEAMKKTLQGTDTDAYFGDNYIYAEAAIEASTYAQIDYQGKKGMPDLFAAPGLINKMMLARDRNGRRMYSTRKELASALNVANIYEIKKLENITRTDEKSNEHKLLGIIVNLKDYQVGNVKGGEITSFEDFDIDFNSYKYLIETRISGALVNPFTAIVLEEPVKPVTQPEQGADDELNA